MNIRDHSSKFLIYLYSANVDVGASAKVSLSQAGYDAYFFQSASELMDRLREQPPHLLIFTTNSLVGTLSQFVQDVRACSDEIRFIAVSSVGQFDILAQYNQAGLVDVVSDETVGLESRVVWSTDRACENLYWQFQNEQMLNVIKTKEVERKTLGKELQQKQSQVLSDLSMSVRINDYLSGSSKEEIIQKFMSQVEGVPCIFFKYLASVRSFVATHSQGFSSLDVQGVGAQLSAEELSQLSNQIAVGLLPPSFSKMLVEAFQFDPPKGWPLYVQNQLEGVLVYNGREDEQKIQLASEEFSLFRLVYSHFALEKKVDSLEVQDAVTEVLNRATYTRFLREEFERARRLKHPLSVVKVSLDDFIEIEQSMGAGVRDGLLRSLALLIQKTSRSHDKTARTGENEIAMILPHSSRKGAAVRAERIRRIVESSQLLENGIRVTVSLGISEYPSLCSTAESLDESATKALVHIVDKGGNKLCLYKAQASHQPEFVVEAES